MVEGSSSYLCTGDARQGRSVIQINSYRNCNCVVIVMRSANRSCQTAQKRYFFTAQRYA